MNVPRLAPRFRLCTRAACTPAKLETAESRKFSEGVDWPKNGGSESGSTTSAVLRGSYLLARSKQQGL